MMVFHIFQSSLFSQKIEQCCSQLASLSVSVFFILPLPAHLLHSPMAVFLHTNMMCQHSPFVLQHTTCCSAAWPTAAFSFHTQSEIQVSNDIKKKSISVSISYKALYFKCTFMQKDEEEVSGLPQDFFCHFKVVVSCHFYITYH